MHRCLPGCFNTFFGRGLSLLFLGFLRCHSILLSYLLEIFRRFLTGGARIQLSCIEIECVLVKRKVNVEGRERVVWDSTLRRSMTWTRQVFYLTGGERKRLRAIRRTPGRATRTSIS